MSLITLNKQNDDETLDIIFNNELIIYEDIQGSKIYVRWTGNKFEIKPKSLSAEPINMIDLAMQKFYNPVYKYLTNLPDRVKSLLNKKWWFCFEYFPDEQPANIHYRRMPKNGLVLTSISKGGNFDYTIDELDEYARLIDVDSLPIVFSGKLTDRMKEAIKYFVHTNEKDLEFVFGEKNFAFFFYKILNPSIKNSFLMDSEEYSDNLEKLLIKVNGSNLSFQLLNPLYRRISDTNSTEFAEVYSLILLQFLTFCQSVNLNTIKLSGNRKDDIYINLISTLYNLFVSETKEDLLKFQFTIPDFFDKEKFKINKEMISNKATIEFIEEDPKLEYIFKSILGSFNKKRKKPIGVFTEKTIDVFNGFVQELEELIETSLKRGKEKDLMNKGLMDFSNFFEIQYDKDGEGMPYPEIYNEFEKGTDMKKKKGIPGKKDIDMGGFQDVKNK